MKVNDCLYWFTLSEVIFKFPMVPSAWGIGWTWTTSLRAFVRYHLFPDAVFSPLKNFCRSSGTRGASTFHKMCPLTSRREGTIGPGLGSSGDGGKNLWIAIRLPSYRHIDNFHRIVPKDVHDFHRDFSSPRSSLERNDLSSNERSWRVLKDCHSFSKIYEPVHFGISFSYLDAFIDNFFLGLVSKSIDQ